MGGAAKPKLPPDIELRHGFYVRGQTVPTHDFSRIQERGIRSNHRDICASNEDIEAYIKRTLAVNPNALKFPYFYYEVQ